MIDIQPATQRTVHLVTSLPGDQLGLPTPCHDTCVGDLIDHLGMFALGFRAVARKESEPRSGRLPPPSAANLETGWRDRISRDLLALADEWQRPEAWEGSTYVGGVEMPAAVAGLVALDELVVHGWDLSVATSQPYAPAPHEIEATMQFVASFDGPRDGTLFGPIVQVADGSADLDRLLGLTGRDPRWRPMG
jgi:uncharacterized protein (TIGR03086 family)